VILFTVTALDDKGPRHIAQRYIPLRFEAADMAASWAAKDHEIATLKAELKRLTSEREQACEGPVRRCAQHCLTILTLAG
jgi:hypothetical protein